MMFIGDPAESLKLRDAGLDLVPEAAGAVQGAVWDQAMHDNPFARSMRALTRFGEYGGAAMPEAATAIPLDALSPTLSAEDANKRYKLPGLTPFSAPIPETVAEEIYKAHQDKLARQAIMDRREDGLLTGQAAQFGTALLAGLTDPLNIASAFIPIVPGARVAAALAGASGTMGRVGVRAGVGAVEGAAGAALIEPLIYATDLQEHNDWTMGNAALNIVLGAAMGGVLHTSVGAVSDWRAGAADRARAAELAKLAPETRELMARSTIAAILEDRPVNVAALMESAEASRARTELAQWARQTERLFQETDAAIAATTGQRAADWSPVVARAEDNFAALRREADDLRAEIDSIQGRLAGNDIVYHATNTEFDVFDFSKLGENTKKNATSEGLAETSKLGAWFSSKQNVGEQFGADIVVAARLDIKNPRTFRTLETLVNALSRSGGAEKLKANLIKNGHDGIILRNDEELGGSSFVAFNAGQINRLDVSRDIAQQRGLLAELARLTEREGRAKVALTQAERANMDARRLDAENETVGNRMWQIEEARIESRAEVLQNMAERTIRRYAAGQGAVLEPGEATRLAVDILTAKDIQAASRAALASLDARAGVPYAAMDAPLIDSGAAARLDSIASTAERAAGDAATEIDPRIAQTARDIAETMATAPKAEGHIAQQTAEMAKLQADLDLIVKAERDGGRISPEQERIIQEFDEAARVAEGDAKATEAAGFCAAMRG